MKTIQKKLFLNQKGQFNIKSYIIRVFVKPLQHGAFPT